MRKFKWLFLAAALVSAVAFMTGCENDDSGEHKITFHNKSSYTVTQRVSGYGRFSLEPGTKRAFNDSSMNMYEYSPKGSVVRVKEDMHTVVYRNR